MNVSPLIPTVGNVCIGLATLIYVLPVQVLLLELRRKRGGDGSILGGVLAAIGILVPMWLLMIAALLCVTAVGGLAWLPLTGGGLYTFSVLALLAMAVVSFARFETVPNASRVTRLIADSFIHLFPLATILLVASTLNPGLAPGITIPFVKLIWLVCAGFSLLLCGGYLVYRIASAGISRVRSFVIRLGPHGPSNAELIALVATLDPQRDFTELLRRASRNERRSVRDAATARLRTNPGFVENLATALNARNPHAAVEFLPTAALSSTEKMLLARPTHTAIESLINDIPAPNYMPSNRRKQLLRWGRKTIPGIAKKFSGTDVDFEQVLASFEYALRPDDTRRR